MIKVVKWVINHLFKMLDNYRGLFIDMISKHDFSTIKIKEGKWKIK